MNYVKRLFKYMYGQGYTESRRPRAPFVFSIYIKSPPRVTRHLPFFLCPNFIYSLFPG